MLYLQVFGDDIEQAPGRGRYLLFHLLRPHGTALFECIEGDWSRMI
jgi:hypothetical protein